MADFKSTYEQQIAKIYAQSAASAFVLSDDENIEVLNALNMGMESFLHEERKIEKESEMELTSIVLNA